MSLRARPGAALAVLLVFVAVLLGWARPARAWVDVNVEADDVRLTVDRTGAARVEHRITLKIAGGPLRSLDLRGVDADAVPSADGYVATEREAAARSLASAVPIAAELVPPSAKPEADGSHAGPVLRVRFQNDKGLGRGVYVLLVRYATNLSSRIKSEGALTRLAWSGLVFDDGLASARLTVSVPSAPTAPRADEGPHEPSAAITPVVLSTVRRQTTADEVELLRPYAPKGEAVLWAIRTDARAFDATSPESARHLATGDAEASLLSAPLYRAIAITGAILCFLLYALLVAFKSADVARESRAAGVAPRPLVPAPAPLRALLAGVALTAGLTVEFVAERATLGALLVVLAIVLAVHRTPTWNPAARLHGRGKWLPVAEAQAFGEPPRRPGGYLDISTRAGKAVAFVAFASVGVGVYFLNEVSAYNGYLAALDATALLAIFGTGRRSELPPNPGVAPARFLRNVAKRVRNATGVSDVRVLGRLRMPDGCSEPDELRLTLAPRAAIPGFSAIEIGVVYIAGAGGAIALPEVLVRFAEGSPCATALEALGRHGRSARGRKVDERVFVFTPSLPTARMTAALAVRLSRAVVAPPGEQEQFAVAPAGRLRQAA